MSSYHYFLGKFKLFSGKSKELPVAIFWGGLIEQYEKLAKQAMQELLPLASTYLCYYESGFS